MKILMVFFVFLSSLLGCVTNALNRPAQTSSVDKLPPSLVDYESYYRLAGEVARYRQGRLLSWEEFHQKAAEPGVVLLDARSPEMYKMEHLKGAINLNFSDFTVETLARAIPSKETTILIYCNNNISGNELHFASKMAPRVPQISGDKPLALALNTPTFINLYGYGYKNVYELASLVDINHPTLEMEGESPRLKIKNGTIGQLPAALLERKGE